MSKCLFDGIIITIGIHQTWFDGKKKRNSMDVSNCSQTGIILNVSKFYIERTVALEIAFPEFVYFSALLTHV